MKKLIYIVILCLIVILSMNNVNNKFVIPSDAIRLRVVANSNTKTDQQIKIKVKENIEKNVYQIVSKEDNYLAVKAKLNENIKIIDNGILKTLDSNDTKYKYNINLGLNYFPEKEYKGVIYKEGYYDSLLVTLGEGKGDNWWCVLFPPLCLLEAEESEEVEYKFFVKEMFSKIFKH